MNKMKTTGYLLKIKNIPRSEFSLFAFLFQKMGWKIRSENYNPQYTGSSGNTMSTKTLSKKSHVKTHLLPLVIALFLFACTSKNTNQWLEQSESYLNRTPDSTLIILQKIKNPHILPAYSKAKYNLYYTTANIQKGIQNQTDSLLTEAIDIFIAQNDSANTAQACFWAGFINMQTENYTRADSLFVQGIPFAPNASLRTRLLSYSGFTLLSNNQPKQALQRHLQSLQDTVFLSTIEKAGILADIGQAYRHNGRPDSAISYYQQAIQQSLKSGSNEQTAFFYERISDIKKAEGDIKEATAALKSAIKFSNRRINYPYQMLAQAQIYIAAGETDSAGMYLKNAIQSPDSYVATLAYQLQANLYEQIDKAKQAYYARKNHLQSLSNISHEVHSEIMKQRYQEELLKNENNELKLKKKQQDIYLLSLFLILISACTIWYIIYNRLRKKKIISEQQLKEQALKNQVAQLEKERELISLRERATALREQLFRRLSASQKIPSLAGKTKENAEDSKSRLTTDEIEELIKTINEIWPGFAERLKRTYPLLRTKDIAFCCLLKSGISTKDLASIYYITPSAISQKKVRMKREKFELEKDARTLDEILNAF